MAKRNVDLTSKEWRDLIFADKNKDFGAYKLREQSDKRHNMAFLYMLIGLAVVVGLILAYSAYRDYADEQARLEMQQREQMLQAQLAEEEMEEPEQEEPEQEKYEEPEVKEVPDNVLETVRVTEINIVDEVKNKMLTQEQKTETETSFGATDQKGVDDPDKAKAFEQKVQHVEEPEPVVVKKEEKQPAKEEVFRAVEQQAQFPGGQAALMKWLSNNIRYPESAQQNDIQGRVVVEFIVEKDGSVGHAKVVKGVDRDLDKEALRVVNKMPKWQPGKNNGVAVRSYFTLPVTFKLQTQ